MVSMTRRLNLPQLSSERIGEFLKLRPQGAVAPSDAYHSNASVGTSEGRTQTSPDGGW